MRRWISVSAPIGSMISTAPEMARSEAAPARLKARGLHPERHFRSLRQGGDGAVDGDPDALVGEGEQRLAVRDVGERGLHQVHLRRADEAGDEDVAGPGEDGVRRGDLLDDAVAHDGDAVGHGQRLELVVRDDHRRLGKAGQHLP